MHQNSHKGIGLWGTFFFVFLFFCFKCCLCHQKIRYSEQSKFLPQEKDSSHRREGHLNKLKCTVYIQGKKWWKLLDFLVRFPSSCTRVPTPTLSGLLVFLFLSFSFCPFDKFYDVTCISCETIFKFLFVIRFFVRWMNQIYILQEKNIFFK